MKEKVLVIIPAYNEEKSLAAVCAEIRGHLPQSTILVVSDGSEDNTAQVARSQGVQLLDLPVNLGVGGAMRAGYLYARRHDFDWAVQVDADGQHDARNIPAMIRKATEDGLDLVIGSRFAQETGYDVHGPRKWAMKVLSKTLSHICKTKLTDTTSGFKLASKPLIALFATDFPAEYLGDTLESLVIASRSGAKIAEVPVKMRKRMGGTPSHNPYQSAKYLFRAVFALAIAVTRKTHRTIHE
ncbi:glycosyltransferase family 2 protein [Arcanobacterium sp. S3PF19]|uniref:glycosyltransferase family 2 protein n=1 Tax=Arcanobacterium sp. S3PF19 TaxID=1219585 RepID=UPI001E29BF6A|nr:glycosyltransferase family 2 protein [Arcanobacterium sp. S3PF19]